MVETIQAYIPFLDQKVIYASMKAGSEPEIAMHNN